MSISLPLPVIPPRLFLLRIIRLLVHCGFLLYERRLLLLHAKRFASLATDYTSAFSAFFRRDIAQPDDIHPASDSKDERHE